MQPERDDQGQWKKGHSPNPFGRPAGSRNKGSYELRERLKARPSFIDPAEFLCDIIADKSLSLECRFAASGNLMSYLYSKLGAITPQRFMETKIAVPEFRSVDDVEKFLNHLARHVARGSLSLDHGKELADLARQWVHTHYADDELRIKLAASVAHDPSHPLKIIIEGGLPALPGTNVSMPYMNGHQGPLSDPNDPVIQVVQPQADQPDADNPR